LPKALNVNVNERTERETDRESERQRHREERSYKCAGLDSRRFPVAASRGAPSASAAAAGQWKAKVHSLV